MPRPTFQGMKLIIRTADRGVLRSVLPESLRNDFDTSDIYYTGDLSVIMGDMLNLEQGLSWGVEYHTEAIVVWAVDPNMNLTYEQVRAFEDSLSLREHSEILFSPIAQQTDERTKGIIQGNHIMHQYWDAGLVGPGTPNP